MKSWTHAAKTLDFWLFGGLVLALWVPSQIIGLLGEHSPRFTQTLEHLGVLALQLQFVINFPHFIASYYLAYSRPPSFWIQHWVALLLVPITLIGALTWIVLSYRNPETRNLADTYLGIMMAMTFVSVGWHYAKQHYGCVVAAIGRDRYPASKQQKDLIRYSLLSVWWMSSIMINTSHSPFMYRDLSVPSAHLPFWWVVFPTVIMMVLTFKAMTQVAQKNFDEHGVWPPVSAQAAWLSLPLSLLSIAKFKNLPLVYVPLLHSAQYLLFVVRRLRSRWQLSPQQFQIRIGLWFVSMCVIGWLAAEKIPNVLSQSYPWHASASAPVKIAFVIFLNIHHYFIDNVLWLRTDPDMAKHIVGSLPSETVTRPNSILPDSIPTGSISPLPVG